MTLYEPPEQSGSRQDDEAGLSIARALLHALLTAAVVFALGFGLHVLVLGGGPQSSGEAVARYALVAALLALLWSVGTQLGNAPLSAVGGLGILAVLLLLLLAPFLFTARFSAAERAVPFSVDDGRLCQPALDVVFPRPGNGIRLDRDPPDELRVAAGRSVYRWYYRDPGDGEAIVFLVSKLGGDSEESFTDFVRGLERRLDGGTTADRRLRWRGGAGSYRYGWSGDGGAAHDLLCRASGERPRGRRPLVACLLTIAADHQILDPVRRGLAFEECGGVRR